MFRVRRTDNGMVSITRSQLEQLRMLADWQVRARGFQPASITMACQLADEHDLASERAWRNCRRDARE